MRVYVQKLTDTDIMRQACKYTLHSHKDTNVSLRRIYGCEHSPSRTQMFWIELDGIPSYVSTHLVRHKFGVEHYVETNRLDRGAKEVANRNTPVNHAMLINAQALINMSRKRLCTKAAEETREVMERIKYGVSLCDGSLSEFMVPECLYRGKCYEPNSCGLKESYYT